MAGTRELGILQSCEAMDTVWTARFLSLQLGDSGAKDPGKERVEEPVQAEVVHGVDDNQGH
jgi:hypothetical protein